MKDPMYIESAILSTAIHDATMSYQGKGIPPAALTDHSRNYHDTTATKKGNSEVQ